MTSQQVVDTLDSIRADLTKVRDRIENLVASGHSTYQYLEGFCTAGLVSLYSEMEELRGAIRRREERREQET